jgi:hypothetical protein
MKAVKPRRGGLNEVAVWGIEDSPLRAEHVGGAGHLACALVLGSGPVNLLAVASKR